jgi:hypothetical protein
MIANANTAEGQASSQYEDSVPAVAEAATEAQSAQPTEIKQESATTERLNENSNTVGGVSDQDTDMDTTL